VSNLSKGCIFAFLIGIGVVAYFIFFGIEPKVEASIYTSASVENYLDHPPDIDTSTIAARGRQAVDFTYATIDNRVISLSDYFGQKYIIIDFWATWCPPCQMELPELEEFFQDRGDEVQIIAVSSEEAEAVTDIYQCIQEKAITFPVFHDPSGSIDKVYPHDAIPFLVLIDKDGILRATYTGATRTEDLVRAVFGI
jgi:cytochrome c biogenesis protein CcmG, thiol:disulfide interchange protein DsbE